MTTQTINRLVHAQYTLADVQGTLQDVARQIAASGIEGSHAASKALLEARSLVRKAVLVIDTPLTDAAILAESLNNPAF